MLLLKITTRIEVCSFWTASNVNLVVSVTRLHRIHWGRCVLGNWFYLIYVKQTGSGGSSIGRTRRTPPPPVLGENIAFLCIFLKKVKLTPLFQPKCGLRPLLLHILNPPLDGGFRTRTCVVIKIDIWLIF